MLDTARLQALQKICRSYRPSVAAEFISEELGFDSIHTAHSFLIKAGCVLIKDKESGELLVSTGDSVINSAEIYTQDKLLL